MLLPMVLAQRAVGVAGPVEPAEAAGAAVATVTSTVASRTAPRRRSGGLTEILSDLRMSMSSSKPRRDTLSIGRRERSRLAGGSGRQPQVGPSDVGIVQHRR